MIVRPTTVNPLLDKRLVRYSFDTGPKHVDMYVRGAVAWPSGGTGGPVPGFMLVAGQDVSTKRIYIFDEYSAITFDPLYDLNRHQEVGFKLFFNQAWMKYGCNTWFYLEDELIHKHWTRQVYGDLILRPIGESFIRTPFEKDEVADNILRELMAIKLIQWAKQSELNEQFQDIESRQRHALRCLVVGYDHLPWIDYHKEQELKEYWL